jgi:hypothetical protein
MTTIMRSIANALAKVKTEVIETRWLRGHRYALIKTRSKADGIHYQWANDQYQAVGTRYRSHEMANVHFGDWEGTER